MKRHLKFWIFVLTCLGVPACGKPDCYGTLLLSSGLDVPDSVKILSCSGSDGKDPSVDVTAQLTEQDYAQLRAQAEQRGYLPIQDAAKWLMYYSTKPYKDQKGLVKLWGQNDVRTAVLIDESHILVVSYNDN